MVEGAAEDFKNWKGERNGCRFFGGLGRLHERGRKVLQLWARRARKILMHLRRFSAKEFYKREHRCKARLLLPFRFLVSADSITI